MDGLLAADDGGFPGGEGGAEGGHEVGAADEEGADGLREVAGAAGGDVERQLHAPEVVEEGGAGGVCVVEGGGVLGEVRDEGLLAGGEGGVFRFEGTMRSGPATRKVNTGRQRSRATRYSHWVKENGWSCVRSSRKGAGGRSGSPPCAGPMRAMTLSQEWSWSWSICGTLRQSSRKPLWTTGSAPRPRRMAAISSASPANPAVVRERKTRGLRVVVAVMACLSRLVIGAFQQLSRRDGKRTFAGDHGFPAIVTTR